MVQTSVLFLCKKIDLISVVSGELMVVVVELYTSQGCSSCPPADKVLCRIGEMPDVLALTMAVDYWDYIGWKDTFALPQHSRRQERYMSKWGSNTIYTPQAIINGDAEAPGSNYGKIVSIIENKRRNQSEIIVSLQMDSQGLSVSISAGAAAKATIWFIRFYIRSCTF